VQYNLLGGIECYYKFVDGCNQSMILTVCNCLIAFEIVKMFNIKNVFIDLSYFFIKRMRQSGIGSGNKVFLKNGMTCALANKCYVYEFRNDVSTGKVEKNISI